MKIDLLVKFADGRPDTKVTTISKDVVSFERQYERPLSDVFSAGSSREEWFLYLAWSVLHRTKQEPRAFDEFLDDVAGLEFVGDESAPFPPAPGDGASPDSPAEPESPSTP
jgi:hypothetical protein